jgi:hypothetical protein
LFVALAAAALAAVGATSAARAAEGFVIGDSTAASFAQTVGIKSIASHSVSVRRSYPRPIAPQFARLPKGAVTLMLLGLNDAFTPVKGLKKDIEWVIEGALATGEKIVWVGPPCVLKKWDSRAKEMDDYLRQRLASTSIQYVSLRDPQICQPALRASDGMHFTTAGNRYVWEKIKRDSSYAATIVLAKPATAPPVASKRKPKTDVAPVASKKPKSDVTPVASKAKPRPKRRQRDKEADPAPASVP